MPKPAQPSRLPTQYLRSPGESWRPTTPTLTHSRAPSERFLNRGGQAKQTTWGFRHGDRRCAGGRSLHRLQNRSRTHEPASPSRGYPADRNGVWPQSSLTDPTERRADRRRTHSSRRTLASEEATGPSPLAKLPLKRDCRPSRLTRESAQPNFDRVLSTKRSGVRSRRGSCPPRPRRSMWRRPEGSSVWRCDHRDAATDRTA